MISQKLINWESAGTYIFYGPFRHKLFARQIGDPNASPNKTLLLLHGFPESSFSYHKICEGMLHHFDRIVLFDMIGYGFSDKPLENYSYSLLEQADTAFTVWNHFKITGGHLLAHDMGNSVATEILFRQENKSTPSWFTDGLLSITFTNGSMVLELANLRITQKLLLSGFGRLFSKIINYNIFNLQIRSAHGNKKISDEDIQLMWELNNLQNGQTKVYLTIKYIIDRKQFEKSRWLPALNQTTLPIHFCWGDQDAVAKVTMAYYLKNKVCKEAKLSIMQGSGHFCQLGNPNDWLQHVSSFY